MNKIKVKIGNDIFDSDKEPIMLVLDSEEKNLISNMGEQRKFCVFPDDIRPADIEKFMNALERGKDLSP